MKYKIYTDGGKTLSNLRPDDPDYFNSKCAYAFVLLESSIPNKFEVKKTYSKLAKFDETTGPVTNNMMELMAVISSLEYFNDKVNGDVESLRLFTDSKYVQFGITKFIKVWLKNNWCKVGSRNQIQNIELWKRLNTIRDKVENKYNIDIEFEWVPGHAGNQYNELCDKMVNELTKGDNSDE